MDQETQAKNTQYVCEICQKTHLKKYSLNIYPRQPQYTSVFIYDIFAITQKRNYKCVKNN